MENVEIKHYQTITNDLVDLFKLLNKDMNDNSPLRIKYGEDCFHDLKDMTDSFIAYRDKQPVGCAILVRKSDEVGFITNIYVTPDCRRSGICFRLFDVVEAQAKKRGHLILLSDTWNELIPMQKAFTNGGYTRYKLVSSNDWEAKYYNSGLNYWKLLV